MKLQSPSAALKAHRKYIVAGSLVATIIAAHQIFAGSGTANWWVKAPVAAAGIDNSRALITLENDSNLKSSIVVVRSNLAKEVTRLQVLPSYFDILAVSTPQVLVAKRGIARAQCLNTETGKIQAALDLPVDFHLFGASTTGRNEFLLWGRGSGGRTFVFNSNCSRLTLVANVKESLRLICPVGDQVVAIDFLGVVFRAGKFFNFEVTNQKFRHLDVLACGDSGITGHLRNASGDFLASIGPKSALTQPFSNAKGVYVLVFEPRDAKWFGLKHGRTSSTVSLFPITH